MDDDNALGDVAARIHEAAWKEGARSEIIKEVCEHLGAAGGVFLDYDYGQNDFVHISDFGLPSVQKEFLEEIAQDPGIEHIHVLHSLSHQQAHTVTDYDFLSEEQIDSHAFYDWLWRACHVRYFIGSRLNERGPNAHLLGLHYTKSDGHANDQQVRHCALLRPHIANAFRVAALREQLDDVGTFSEMLSARSPHGLVGLNQRGKCISINEMAEHIFAQDDGISVGKDGELLIHHPESSKRIGKQIGDAIRASEGGDLFAGGEVLVPRTSGRGSYLIRITPGLRLRYGFDVGIPVVMLTISDPEARLTFTQNSFSDLFGLTRREAEIVHLILNGTGLPQVAETMGISHNTARVHLRSIFDKTDCRSQSELISKIGRLV